MTFLSATLDRIGASPTVAMSNRAAALKAEGADVIALAAGEPDFNTPEHIIEAANDAALSGKTKYTAVDGIPELKAAISRKFERENGIVYEPAQISVGSGGKHIIWNAFLATLNPGDEVIIPAPYWVSYPDMVQFSGGIPIILPCGADQGFKLDPDALAAAITPRTKWLILNSPSNPTGAAYSKAELEALIDVVRPHANLHVMCDDIYEHIAYPPFEFTTIAAIAPDLKDRVLTVNGVSKAYAMTGWRIGYAGGSVDLISAMRKIQSQSTTNPSSIGQWAAVAALDGPQDYLTHSRTAFLRRRDMVVAALNKMDGVFCPEPEGAFYVYPSVEGLIGATSRDGRTLNTDQDVAEALLEQTGVALVFGGAFGLSPHVRISYAAADDQLADAMARMADFVKGCA